MENIEHFARILNEAVTAIIFLGCIGMVALFWLPS